jgi:hypothetical protein
MSKEDMWSESTIKTYDKSSKESYVTTLRQRIDKLEKEVELLKVKFLNYD